MQLSLHFGPFVSPALSVLELCGREEENGRKKENCVRCDARVWPRQSSTSNFAFSGAFRTVASVFISVPGDVDWCCAAGPGVSVYNAWGISYAFAGAPSYRNALTQLSVEIRLIAHFKVQKKRREMF